MDSRNLVHEGYSIRPMGMKFDHCFYIIKPKGGEYVVNAFLRTCNCKAGLRGQMCFHVTQIASLVTEQIGFNILLAACAPEDMPASYAMGLLIDAEALNAEWLKTCGEIEDRQRSAWMGKRAA